MESDETIGQINETMQELKTSLEHSESVKAENFTQVEKDINVYKSSVPIKCKYYMELYFEMIIWKIWLIGENLREV